MFNIEIRISKSETNPKYECSNVKNNAGVDINEAETPFRSLEF